MRNWWLSPPQWAQRRAATDPTAQNCKEQSPLDRKPLKLGNRVMTARRKWSFRKPDPVFLVPGKFSRLHIPTEKMKPGSCLGVQPFILEMTLGGGSWPLSLRFPILVVTNSEVL